MHETPIFWRDRERVSSSFVSGSTLPVVGLDPVLMLFLSRDKKREEGMVSSHDGAKNISSSRPPYLPWRRPGLCIGGAQKTLGNFIDGGLFAASPPEI